MRRKIRLRAPKGFRIQYRKISYDGRLETVEVELYDRAGNKTYPVGHVSLERHTKDSFVTHSNLDQAYWNRGLGTLIYAKAISWCLNHGYRVRSSGGSSDMAKRVWSGKGLRQTFDIQKRVRRYTYNTAETWYAYKKGTLDKRKKKGKRK